MLMNVACLLVAVALCGVVEYFLGPRMRRRVASLERRLEALMNHAERAEELVAKLQEKAKVDGEVFNLGRSEGRADVAAMLRKRVDPGNKDHLDLDGLLARVEHLALEAGDGKPEEPLRTDVGDAVLYVLGDEGGQRKGEARPAVVVAMRHREMPNLLVLGDGPNDDPATTFGTSGFGGNTFWRGTVPHGGPGQPGTWFRRGEASAVLGERQ